MTPANPTSSALWITNFDFTYLEPLADDAGRPARGSGAAAPAVAPHVDMALNGTNVTLSWVDNEANTGGYKVRHSERPYFLPDDRGVTTVSLPKGSTGWTHTGGG